MRGHCKVQAGLACPTRQPLPGASRMRRPPLRRQRARGRARRPAPAAGVVRRRSAATP
jgi:hypothetical protein